MNKDTQTNLDVYNKSAEKLAAIYNNLSIPKINPGLEERLPVSTPENRLKALDLGCGTGHAAHWLAEEKGFDVVAIDGAADMIRVAQEKRAHPHVTYMVDLLPEIGKVKQRGEKFDVVLLSAVWMHLDTQERKELVDNIAAIANQGALVYISLRHGDNPPDRPMFSTSVDELRELAQAKSLSLEYLGSLEDKQGRGNVSWEYVALRP
jgi:2-polyprenyl-3-methyl-5-hydroxy-6-metoxy-1,4-benzoquinol methylase